MRRSCQLTNDYAFPPQPQRERRNLNFSTCYEIASVVLLPRNGQYERDWNRRGGDCSLDKLKRVFYTNV